MILHVDISVDITSLQVLDYKGNGGEGGIRTLGTVGSPYNGLAKHRGLLLPTRIQALGTL